MVLREGGRSFNRFQSTPTFPPDLKSIKSIKSIAAALSDFHHAGEIILWRMGAEKIICETKNIRDKTLSNTREFHDEFKC